MASHIRWMIDNKIIYYRIVGQVTPDDIVPVDMQINGYLNQSDAKDVHLLIDTTLMTASLNIASTMRLSYLSHAKLGYIITNERTAGEIFLFNNIGKLFNLSYRFVKTLDDAIPILHSIDNHLPSINIMRTKLYRAQQMTLDDDNQL